MLNENANIVDYLIKDRQVFVAILLEEALTGSVLQIDGKLPKDCSERLEPFEVQHQNHKFFGIFNFRVRTKKYLLNDQSRIVLSEILVLRDKILAENLFGLVLLNDNKPLVEMHHLYDYGSSPSTEHKAIVHSHSPGKMLERWQNSDSGVPAE